MVYGGKGLRIFSEKFIHGGKRQNIGKLFFAFSLFFGRVEGIK